MFDLPPLQQQQQQRQPTANGPGQGHRPAEERTRRKGRDSAQNNRRLGNDSRRFHTDHWISTIVSSNIVWHLLHLCMSVTWLLHVSTNQYIHCNTCTEIWRNCKPLLPVCQHVQECSWWGNSKRKIWCMGALCSPPDHLITGGSYKNLTLTLTLTPIHCAIDFTCAHKLCP